MSPKQDRVPDRALEGLRVVVTRSGEKASNLIGLLRNRGAEVVHFPTISIADPESWADLDRAIVRLRNGDYEWVVFTSVNAVEKMASRLDTPAEDLAHARIAAVGAATTGALGTLDVEIALVPGEFTGEALAEALGPGSGRLLLPRVAGAPRATVHALEDRGWSVDEVVAYRNVVPTSRPPQLDRVHAITFASGSAARNFAALQDCAALGLSRDADPSPIVVCIGPSTAEEARSAGLRVDVVADVHTDEGMVEALERSLS